MVRRVVVVGLCLATLGCSEADEGPQTGDCFSDPPREVAATPTVDCGEAEYELVAVAQLDDEGTYPGLEALSSLAFDRCSSAVAAYIGQDVLDSEYDIWFHHPDEAAWSDGDRQFVCAVTRIDGRPLGGSTAG